MIRVIAFYGAANLLLHLVTWVWIKIALTTEAADALKFSLKFYTETNETLIFIALFFLFVEAVEWAVKKWKAK